MRRASVLVTGVLALAVACAGARGEQASVLLEAGVYAEEVVGDLDRAIESYQKIIADAEANRPCVAEAHYRLGKCYLARGKAEQAREEFALVTERYPDQAKLAEAAERELAKLQPPAAPAGELTFGPVIERVVNDDGEQVNMLIDLDTGKLFSASDFLGIRNNHEVVAAMRRMGIDAGGETAAGVRGLGVVDTVSVSVGTEGWDASAEEVTRQLEGRLPAATEPGEGGISAVGGVPATFFFKTREGGMGILQILELRDQPPRGVKIRYKMVQKELAGEQVVRVTVPPMDTHHVALDLSAGQLVPTPMFPSPGEPEEWTAATEQYIAAMKDLSRGDVGFGYYEKRPVVFLLCGAVADRPLAQFPHLPFSYFAVSQQRFPAGLEVTTREGATYEVIVMGVDERGCELEYRRIQVPETAGMRPSPDTAARLAELRIRLADAKAELSASEATVRYWQREIERAEPLAQAGRADATEVERARLELSRARAAQEAARQKAEILTQEIARLLPGMSAQGPGGPFPETQLHRKVEREEEKQAVREAVHAVGVAMEMYKADHDGAYPPSPEEMERGGYLRKEDSLFRRWPELGWRYVIPQTKNAGAVMLYYWPPVDGEVAVLHEDQAVQWVKVGSDGVLRNPRTGETIATAADSP